MLHMVLTSQMLDRISNFMMATGREASHFIGETSFASVKRLLCVNF